VQILQKKGYNKEKEKGKRVIIKRKKENESVNCPCNSAIFIVESTLCDASSPECLTPKAVRGLGFM
jgi:hypothetical protein